MSMTTIIVLAVSLLSALVCLVIGILIFLLLLGFILLRRRGKKKVTAKEAVSAGVESVSQVFVRGKGGLEDYDDDDD